MSAPRRLSISVYTAEGGGYRAGMSFSLGLLVVLYAAARVAQAFPDQVPLAALAAAHVLLPLLFALIHGAQVYRIRGILIFTALCLVVGNLLENMSIVTGFPFGRYHFTDVMGPKLFYVPLLLGLAYVGMGYLSWTLARLILGGVHEPLIGSRILTRPLVAAFLMVAWDLSTDPIWSNLARGWVWHDGGPYFGVPLSSFLGWYLTVYLIYQGFALYLRGRPASRPLSPAFWRLAVLMYGICAIGNLFVISPPGLSVITDASGVQWRVNDILEVCKLISIFVMGAFALMAWVRIMDDPRVSRHSPQLGSRTSAD
jgi:uncharacterized membrane protein